MGLRGRIGSAGRLAMWAAAYALVFQAFLTGALVSAMPVGDAAAPLCLSSSAPAAPSPDGGENKGGPHFGRCDACLVRADLSGLPPPVPTPFVGRVALELEFRAVVRRALRAAPFRLPLQPRAPPAFA